MSTCWRRQAVREPRSLSCFRVGSPWTLPWWRTHLPPWAQTSPWAHSRLCLQMEALERKTVANTGACPHSILPRLHLPYTIFSRFPDPMPRRAHMRTRPSVCSRLPAHGCRSVRTSLSRRHAPRHLRVSWCRISRRGRSRASLPRSTAFWIPVAVGRSARWLISHRVWPMPTPARALLPFGGRLRKLRIGFTTRFRVPMPLPPAGSIKRSAPRAPCRPTMFVAISRAYRDR